MEKRIDKKIDDLNETIQPVIQLYRSRWLILINCITYSCLSSFQWIQYPIITNLLVKYYNINASAVEWLSMGYLLLYPIFLLPASFVIDKWGLRAAALFGALTTTLAAVIKLLSIGPDRYYVVLIAQILGGISQPFIMPLPPKIAATWFPPEEASTVCALGLLSGPFGIALGFLIPTIIVTDHENLEDIGSDMDNLNWGLAAICVVSAIMILIYYPKQPLHAPSLAAYYQRKNRVNTTIPVFWNTLKKLMKNKPFLLYSMSYGITYAIYNGFDTILNQLILQYFPGAQQDAGKMGLVMLLVGMAGTVAIGIILDKTRKFKESSIVVALLCALTTGAFIYALEVRSKWMCYMSISSFGLFIGAFLPVGIEFVTELTYPLPESTVSGILVTMVQLNTVVLTILLSYINTNFGAFYCLLVQVVTFVFVSLITYMTPSKLYRQEAFKKGTVAADVYFQKIDQVDV